MREADYNDDMSLSSHIDETTSNLVGNLRWRWNWALIDFDRYIGDDNMEISLIYGYHKVSDGQYAVRITLSETAQKRTLITLAVWSLKTSGWPAIKMPFSNPNVTQYHYTARDIFKFCEEAHGQGDSLMDWVRGMFSGSITRRNHNR